MSSSTLEAALARSAGQNSWAAALARPIKRGLAWIAFRRQLRRDMRELMTLDDRTLRDIGLRRSEISSAVRCGRRSDR